jgi:hypothetical protein
MKFLNWRRRKDYLKNRRPSWIGHTIRHNYFVVYILDGEIYGKKGRRKTSTIVLEASREKNRSWQLYSDIKNCLQQFQTESCQPIKRLQDKKMCLSFQWLICMNLHVIYSSFVKFWLSLLLLLTSHLYRLYEQLCTEE